MPLFRYKGRGNRGDAIEGTMEAASPDAVATQLFANGVIPVDISEAPQHVELHALFRRWLGAGGPHLSELILFSRQMHALMKAGIPIVRAMRGLAETNRNAAMAAALHDAVEQLEAGRELSAALSQHSRIFGPLLVSIVRVGESTGQLDVAFMQIARYLDLEKDTRDRIKLAMRYPALVMAALAVALGIINLVVIPTFAKVFRGMHAELPWATRLLMNLSEFALAYWPLLVIGAGVAAVSVHVYLRSETGRYRWDKAKLRLPIVGSILLRALLARFSRSFALATRAGVPLVQALTVVARAVGNEFVSDRILQMRNGIERGDTLTRTATATGLFTPLVLQMLAVGEETGAVDVMLQDVAEFYEREVDYALKNLSSAIEPVLIVAVGVMVLVLALGVFLPMWDLAGAARGG